MYQPPDLLPRAGDAAMPPSPPPSGPPPPPALQTDQHRRKKLEQYPWLAPRVGLVISTAGLVLFFISCFLPWFGDLIGWLVWLFFPFDVLWDYGDVIVILAVLLFLIAVVGLLVTMCLAWFRKPLAFLSGWRLGSSLLGVVSLLIPTVPLGRSSDGGPPAFGYWLGLMGMLLVLVGSFWGPWSRKAVSTGQLIAGAPLAAPPRVPLGAQTVSQPEQHPVHSHHSTILRALLVTGVLTMQLGLLWHFLGYSVGHSEKVTTVA